MRILVHHLFEGRILVHPSKRFLSVELDTVTLFFSIDDFGVDNGQLFFKA